MDERVERYAELVVRVGANVQPGQEVFILPAVEHRELARALARQAYRAGASYVHVRYQDAHVQKAMIELGPEEALTYSPEWLKAFVTSYGGNAMIATTGDPEPELLADLDGERVGRAVPHEIVQIRMQQMSENTLNWCIVGAPSRGWAQQVFGDPDVEQLWEKIAFCMRLDEPDPVAAWHDHIARLKTRAMRSRFATIENADRLGEVALVTNESRVGQTGTLFYDPLFDENATCHIAYGAGFPFLADGDPGEGLNAANMHVDFMVGGTELEVDALLADGSEVPLIRNEEWQLA
jgi:leucyl aminopeptidase (aminopeptidase T)